MSAAYISEFLAAIGTLRQKPHPYSALSHYLASMAALPRWKNGVQVLLYSTIAMNLLLLSAAVLTCFIKIRCGTFHLGSINQDYLLRPNSPVLFALGCVVYSILSVAESLIWITGNDSKGIVTTRGRAALGGIKFIFLWEGAWCFSWNSAGHYICSKWRPPWQPACIHRQIPILVVWGLNTTFMVAALAALLIPLITFTLVELQAQDFLSSIASVCRKLRRLDKHKVVKFDFPTAILILSPLVQALPKLLYLVKCMQIGIGAWFSVLCLIILAQLVFICLAFLQRRVLAPADSLWATIRGMVTYKANADLNSAQKSAFNQAREQRVIMRISFIILLTGTAFLPVVVMQYRAATLEHIRGARSQLWTDLISTFVSTALATVIMIAIFLQTLRLSNQRSKASQHSGRSGEVAMRTFRSHLSEQIPPEMRTIRGSIVKLEDPNKILTTVSDYEQWQKDIVSNKTIHAKEGSEISLIGRSPEEG